MSATQLVSRTITNVSLDHRPGEHWIYSNFGYVLFKEGHREGLREILCQVYSKRGDGTLNTLAELDWWNLIGGIDGAGERTGPGQSRQRASWASSRIRMINTVRSSRCSPKAETACIKAS
jgi:hypothetical protein